MTTASESAAPQEQKPVAEERPFLKVDGLSLRTPLGVVYDNVSFSVKKGQVCCVFGDKGSGKTAMLLTVCGRMKANKGLVKVGPYDLKTQFRLVRRMSNISFIEGLNDVQPFLKLKSIAAAELSLAGKHGNKANTDAFLEKWGFSDKADIKFKDLDAYDTTVFGIVLAMASDPELLIVDDVQGDLTQYQSKKLVAFLKKIAAEYGTAVLFACTEYEIAHFADGIVIVSEEAELQRRAVLRDAADDAEVFVPIFGTGNGVNIDLDKPAGSYQRRPEL